MPIARGTGRRPGGAPLDARPARCPNCGGGAVGVIAAGRMVYHACAGCGWTAPWP